MKKRILAWCLCVLLLGLTACSTPTTDTANPSADQTELPDGKLPEVLHAFLKQAGLTDPDLFSASTTATFADGVTGKAYLFLADDTNVVDTFNSFAFLAIVHNQTVLLNCLDTYALGGTVSAGDLDGDGHSEMLVHLTQGATGGAGNYSTRVLDLQNGQVTELYNFDDFDTGYSIELLKDKKYRITNRLTGYSAEFLREVEHESYFDFWYDEQGVIQEHALLVDSFFECEMNDSDQNGVCELHIRQYTSLVDHADYLGDAVTVLTYNSKANTFEVTKTTFEPQ